MAGKRHGGFREKPRESGRGGDAAGEGDEIDPHVSFAARARDGGVGGLDGDEASFDAGPAGLA
jgi:hypothetical protein